MAGATPQDPGPNPLPGSAPTPPADTPPAETKPPRRHGTALVAGAIALLLLWFGTLTAVVGAEESWPDTDAAQFVPEDGHRNPAAIELDGTRDMATREHGHVRGSTITRSMSLPAYILLDLPAGDPHWWRETVHPEIAVPHWQRIRTVSEDGVRLHVQDWTDLGLAFSPGLLELPADVAPEAEWSSEGVVRGTPDVAAIQRYRNTSRAQAPADSARADQGCLLVTSTTEVTGSGSTGTEPTEIEPWTWQQENLWCPGEGIVQSNAVLGEHAYELSTERGTAPAPVGADRLRPAEPDTSTLDSWQRGTLAAVNGDATFGERDALLAPEGHPVVTTGGEITYREGASTDLVSLAVLSESLHWQTGWARPSGQILSLVPFGSLVVVTTSDREMVGYDPLGRWRWTVRLDDVALEAPVRVGDDLVVATLGGTVGRYRASDGTALWSTQLERGMAVAPAADTETVGVVDTDESVTALDARSGEELWTRDFGVAPESMVVRDGAVIASNYARAQAWQARTGAPRWQNLSLRWAEDLVPGTDTFAVPEENDVRFFATATGEPVGTVAGGTDVARVDDTWFVLTAEDLLAVDRTGATLAAWPLQLPAENRRIVAGGDRVWVFGRQPDDVLLTAEWFGPR